MTKRERMRAWYPKSQQIRRRYLTPYEHRRIAFLVRGGVTMADVARRYEVSYSTVKDIIYGKSKPWRPAGAALPVEERLGG
jgi:transposase